MSDTVFSYGPSSVGTLLATTLSNIREELSLQVFNSNPVFAYMNSKGKRSVRGGATIVEPLLYGKNSAAKSYEGDDIIDVTLQGGMTAASFPWRQYAVPVGLTGREADIQNAGEQQIIDLLTAKLMQAKESLEDRLAIDLFAATQGSKAIQSLVTMIDATSTIGDVNSTTNSWWQSVVTAGGSFASQGISDLRTTWNTVAIRKPTGNPDFLVSDQTTYQYYEGTVLPHLRIQDKAMADLGFANLYWNSAPWSYDANATSGVIYFLNSKVMRLVVHSNRNFAQGDFIEPVDQDVRSKKILWAGNLTTNARRKLAKITSVTA